MGDSIPTTPTTEAPKPAPPQAPAAAVAVPPKPAPQAAVAVPAKPAPLVKTATGQLVSQGTALERVTKMIETDRDLFAVLPAHTRASAFRSIVIAALKADPAVLACKPETIRNACMDAARLGIEPDGIGGRGYLIAYGQECQFIIGYKGLVELAYRSGRVLSIDADIIRDGDPYQYQRGSSPRLDHTPQPSGTPFIENTPPYVGVSHQGRKIVAAYASAELAGGIRKFRLLWWDDIETVRRQAPSSKRQDSPWQRWLPAMCMKTAVRRLCDTLPMSAEAQRAVGVDERRELALPGAEQPLDAVPVRGESAVDPAPTEVPSA